ncbi:MAG TPA: NADH-quinone oxidoreductase subunit N [Candidatus Saccharimonadales bacterium]|nr:NADH-quinone oxidoreductase subunit N [Candidatus Saccharimonadales bacterium]
MITDVGAVLPEIAVTITALLILLSDAVLERSQARRWLPLLAVAGLVAAIFSGPFTTNGGSYFSGFVIVDTFATFFRVLFCVLAILAVLVAPDYLERRRIPAGEYYATVLFSTVGAMAIALSADLISLFVGIELMTIPVYVLAAMQRRDRYSNEAGLKYFLLGAFSSAILLYGFSWLYGIAGTTAYAGIADVVARDGLTGVTAVAIALVTVGLSFKAAVIPFHQWTPDAYDGAPTPATAFMSVAPKAAAFAAILRVFFGALGPLEFDWSVLLAVLAAVTMTGGNVVALAQTNVKRMLAYSSIAHTGYILAAVAAYKVGGSAGAAVLFYVFAYGIMNLGAFACLAYLDLGGTRGATLEELDGFSRRHPGGALAFAVFLISLTGIPPTVGFIAKVFIIGPVLDRGFVWLAVTIALNAVLAAFYYLRVVVHVYMYDPATGAPRILPAPLLSVGLGVAAVATVVLGIVPDGLYRWALQAAGPFVVR